MRYGLIILICCLAGGCADTNANVAQEAANRCASVGISARDPDYNTCMESYKLAILQGAILNNYQQELYAGSRPRRANQCTDRTVC